MLVPRVGQAVSQRTIVREQKQPLAVAVEAADRVDIRNGHIVLQRRSALHIRELAEDVIRLAELDEM